MTKEELIESSDLNRKDNIKYISSEAQGIAITLDSDRYAPTLCKLERAYICGRRKSEEQIAELEKENAELKKNYEDSLIACGVLKAKIDTLRQPSPIEAMQDALITTQKVANEKQKEQLAKAKEIIKALLRLWNDVMTEETVEALITEAEQFLNEVEK